MAPCQAPPLTHLVDPELVTFLAWPSVCPSLKWAWVAVLAKEFGNEGEALCFANRCAATTTRPSTLPATSLPPSAHWRAPRRATSSTWTTSGLANVSLLGPRQASRLRSKLALLLALPPLGCVILGTSLPLSELQGSQL